MQIYHYHPETGEYLGDGLADPSPLEPGKYLVPAHATTSAPPTAMAGKVRVWRGEWVFEPMAQGEPPVDPGYEPSIHDLAAAKLEAINSGKNVALDAGFRFTIGEGEGAREVIFDSDSKARLAYLELATKLGQDPAYATQWKASRGQWVTMDAALFADLQPAYEAHIQACFAWQAEREQELAAAYAAGDRAAMESVAETM